MLSQRYRAQCEKGCRRWSWWLNRTYAQQDADDHTIQTRHLTYVALREDKVTS
jgi:hypothetical protein